jgi:CBS domain-containing protein
MKRNLAHELLRPASVLRQDETVVAATRALLEGPLRALPVVDARGRFTGVFGEREFLAALFPGYVGELHSAAFITAALDETIGRRAASAHEPVHRHMTRDHVEIPARASDLQVAETFLHHRVLILPVVEDGAITGVIDRRDFFAALAETFLRSLPAT